jgi:hypothetical protein
MKGEAAISAREDYEERAAIIEFDAGMSRGTAEMAAYAFLVERLVEDPALPFSAVNECDIARQLDRAKAVSQARRSLSGERVVMVFRPGESFATIMSGCVVRWRAGGRGEFEINASRDGVSFSGFAPIFEGEMISELLAVLAEAREVHRQLASDAMPCGDYPARRAIVERYPSASFGEAIER